MFVLILLLGNEEQETSINPKSIDWLVTIRRGFYLLVFGQLPNTILPMLIRYSRNFKSVTCMSAREASRVSRVAPSSKAPGMSKAVEQHKHWIIEMRVLEFKGYIQYTTVNELIAIRLILLIICAEATLVILVSSGVMIQTSIRCDVCIAGFRRDYRRAQGPTLVRKPALLLDV
jgi:hypothetical protein